MYIHICTNIRRPSGVLRRVRSRPLYCLPMGPGNPHRDSRPAPGWLPDGSRPAPVRPPYGRPHEMTNLSWPSLGGSSSNFEPKWLQDLQLGAKLDPDIAT